MTLVGLTLASQRTPRSLWKFCPENWCESCEFSALPGSCHGKHYKKLDLDSRRCQNQQVHLKFAGFEHEGRAVSCYWRACERDRPPSLSQCLVGPRGSELIWTSVCKMEAPNWSWRSCELVDMQPTVVCAESQNKKCELHDSVKALMPTQSNVTSWTKFMVMSDQTPVKQGDIRFNFTSSI